MTATENQTENRTLQSVYAEVASEMLAETARTLEASVKRNDDRIATGYREPGASSLKWVLPMVEESAVFRSAARELREIADDLASDDDPRERCETLAGWFGQQLGRLIESVAGDWSGREERRAEALVLDAFRKADTYAADGARKAFVEADEFAREYDEYASKARAKLSDRKAKLARARGDRQKADLAAEIQETSEALAHFESSLQVTVEGCRELRDIARIVSLPGSPDGRPPSVVS
jgi:hypothetical protein